MTYVSKVTYRRILKFLPIIQKHPKINRESENYRVRYSILIVFPLSCLKLKSMHVIDSQKLLIAYVCCYILSCCLKIKFLILLGKFI